MRVRVRAIRHTETVIDEGGPTGVRRLADETPPPVARRKPLSLPGVYVHEAEDRASATALVVDACLRLKASPATVLDKALADLRDRYRVYDIEVNTEPGCYQIWAGPNEGDPGVAVYVDELTHGILAVWRHYADTQPATTA